MLIFDFDGVLMDSLPEMAVTAYSTLKGELVTKLDQIPEGALESYFRNRFHIQAIGDAPVLMNWCLETGQSDHEKILSQEEYDSILREIDEPIVQRTTQFFEMRGRFKKKDIDAWLKLNAPVQPLWRGRCYTIWPTRRRTIWKYLLSMPINSVLVFKGA